MAKHLPPDDPGRIGLCAVPRCPAPLSPEPRNERWLIEDRVKAPSGGVGVRRHSQVGAPLPLANMEQGSWAGVRREVSALREADPALPVLAIGEVGPERRRAG